MESVVIKNKKVDRFGRKVFKDVYDFFHDDYILTEFEEMKVEQENLLKSLVTHLIEDNQSLEYEYEDLRLISKIINEDKFEEEVESIKEQVEKGILSLENIFFILDDLNLDFEINEDLFFEKEAFLHLYHVLNSDYTYLED